MKTRDGGRRQPPSKAPGGRTIRKRVAGEIDGPGKLKGSRYVEHRLGKEVDGSDFNPKFCMARSKNHHGQCGQFPVTGRATCAFHGGGAPARVKRGEKPAPADRGRAARAAQLATDRVKRKVSTELPQFADHMPEFSRRMEMLLNEPERAGLARDAAALTVLRDLLLEDEETGATFGGVLKFVPELALAKATVLRTKHELERKDFVAGDRFRAVTAQLIEMLRKYVPEERHPEVARELALLGARPTVEIAAPIDVESHNVED